MIHIDPPMDVFHRVFMSRWSRKFGTCAFAPSTTLWNWDSPVVVAPGLVGCNLAELTWKMSYPIVTSCKCCCYICHHMSSIFAAWRLSEDMICDLNMDILRDFGTCFWKEHKYSFGAHDGTKIGSTFKLTSSDIISIWKGDPGPGSKKRESPKRCNGLRLCPQAIRQNPLRQISWYAPNSLSHVRSSHIASRASYWNQDPST